ncbi:hypothetical protein Efla_005670 [Eimeria flavescens]
MKELRCLLGIIAMAVPRTALATQLLAHSDSRNSSKIDPSIDQLKAMITDQQSKMGALQQELSGLLNEVSSGKQAFQQSRANAGPGATVEIQFPAPPPPPAAAAGPESGPGAGTSAVLEGLAPPEMEEPIPVMVVKPDSVADVEEAVTQVMVSLLLVTAAAKRSTRNLTGGTSSDEWSGGGEDLRAGGDDCGKPRRATRKQPLQEAE